MSKMASHAMMKFVSFVLIPSILSSSIGCMTIPQEVKWKQQKQLYVPFSDFAKLGAPEHPFCEMDVVYSEALLEAGIEVLLRIDYEASLDPSDLIIHSITAYKLPPSGISSKMVSFTPYEKATTDIILTHMEEEIKAALQRNINEMGKMTKTLRKKRTTNFFLYKNKVYARTIIPAGLDDVFQAALEVIQNADLEVEHSNPETGIIQTKTTSDGKEEKKSDFLFIFKFKKTPDDETEVKVVLVMKHYYPPYDGSRKIFKVTFPYSRTLVYLLNRISVKSGYEDNAVEFINSSQSVRDIFSLNTFGPRDIKKMDDKALKSMKPPKLIKKVEPNYPAKLRELGVQGEVILASVIGKDGNVQDIEVLSGIPQGVGLEEAAIKAVSQWKYEPATLNEEPVNLYFTVIVTFSLF